MDNQKININVEGSNGTLTILQGQAPPAREFKPVNYSGNICSPGDWMEGKTKAGYEIRKNLCTLLVNEYEGKIQFNVNEFVDQETSCITGKIEKNPELSIFKINSNKTFLHQELVQLLKMNRIYFSDMEENFAVVSAIDKFKIRFNQEIESSNDFQGNKKNSFLQSVEHDLKLSFKLTVPVYKGEANSVFNVEVKFDISDKVVNFWLESPELREIEQSIRKTIIDREVERFDGFPIIFL